MLKKPKLLDLFCCGGGAGMGYHRAGLEVHGCDKEKQPHYPFPMVRMDWLDYLNEYGHLFDAFHASPPCQKFTQLGALHRSKGSDYDKRHEDLIEPVRTALIATGKPYVIENVVGAPLLNPVMLCGSMFGLRTDCGAQLQRHRLFETNWLCLVPMKCRHGQRSIGVTGTCNALAGGRTIGVHGRPQMIAGNRRVVTITGHTAQQNIVKNQVRQTYSIKQAQQAMGIDWLPQSKLSQAVPPAYTEFIGRQLFALLEGGD